MDKKVFLLDKECYNSIQIEKMTENDLEMADYLYNNSVVKIDANDYDTIEDIPDLDCFDLDDYWLVSFGF